MNLKLNDGTVINADTKANDVFKNAFWHYTSENGANGILNEKMFRINNLTKMNDKNEEKLYGEEKGNIFVLSFVNSNTEKIPMWYLYSGITGKGISLKFTAGTMLSMLKNITHVCDYDTKERYEIGTDIQMLCGWTYYIDAQRAKLYYKSQWIEREVSENETQYFLKDYPWNYEKEYRIVFINKTSIRIKRIGLEIPDSCYKKIEIKTAPEYDSTKVDTLLNREGFKKLALSKLLSSDLSINMDLIKYNFAEFIEFVKEQYDSEHKIEGFDELEKIFRKK